MSYGQPYNYGPPQGQYPPPGQPQWGGPPPPQQPYGGPPPPHHPAHSPQPPYGGGPYQQPPPPQGGYHQQPQHYHNGYQQPPPPPQGYQQPHGYQQGYGGPPPPQHPQQPQYQQHAPPPPPGQYAPPPQQQHYAQPTPPSPGYVPGQVAPVDASRDAEALRAAMKGFGTNEAQLIQVLTQIPDPPIMAQVRQTYSQRFNRDLLSDVGSETSGYFCEALQAIIRGPLQQDVHQLRDALEGAGTKENVLDDVLLGRSNADINAIKNEYQRQFRRPLQQDVRGDLSMKTEQLFDMVLSATRNEDSAPVVPQEIDGAVSSLHHATVGRSGTDQITVCQVFSKHSDGQLRAIAQAFQNKYHQPLAKVIEKEFSGHMESSLLRMLAVAEDRAKADAESLEATMKGMGTKDRLLVNRVVRLHWNKGHWQQVRAAYNHFYRQSLAQRVRGETSRDYQKLMVALCE